MKKILLGIVAATLLLSCSVDEQKTSKVPQEFGYTLTHTTGVLDPSVSVISIVQAYYESFNPIYLTDPFNYETSTLSVFIEGSPIKIEADFYIEDGSNVTITLTSSSGEIIDTKQIQVKNYLYKYEFN